MANLTTPILMRTTKKVANHCAVVSPSTSPSTSVDDGDTASGRFTASTGSSSTVVVISPDTSSSTVTIKTTSTSDLQRLCFPNTASLMEMTNPELQYISETTNQSIVELTTSRVGRDLQRFEYYQGVWCRLTAGCVPILADGSVLLISSTKDPNKFVLAKGGWEQDESLTVSALRETFEEAGITGILGPPLPTITHETRKAAKRRQSGNASSSSSNAAANNQHHSHNRMTIFPLYVQTIHTVWPEPSRRRHAVSLSHAMELLSHRPEMVEVLQALAHRQLQPGG